MTGCRGLQASLPSTVQAAARTKNIRFVTAIASQFIDERAAVVAVPNCDWLDGRMVDLDAVATRCRQVGAALVIAGQG